MFVEDVIADWYLHQLLPLFKELYAQATALLHIHVLRDTWICEGAFSLELVKNLVHDLEVDSDYGLVVIYVIFSSVNIIKFAVWRVIFDLSVVIDDSLVVLVVSVEYDAEELYQDYDHEQEDGARRQY